MGIYWKDKNIDIFDKKYKYKFDLEPEIKEDKIDFIYEIKRGRLDYFKK